MRIEITPQKDADGELCYNVSDKYKDSVLLSKMQVKAIIKGTLNMLKLRPDACIAIELFYKEGK